MRIGILSFAHLHAEGYLSLLQTMPDVTVIGIADENPQRGRYFADLFKVRLFESYVALLAEKPDTVIICSENAHHLALVEMAAAAGVHILCEKPLATTVEDAAHIVTLCQNAGIQLMTAYPMRFSAPILETKQALDAHRLGAIYGCNSTNQGALPEHHQAENLAFLGRNWFVDKTLAGGGALTDHIVHLADLLRWMLKSEVTEVFAETNQVLDRHQFEVETAGLVMLTFENGAFASIDCSWSKPAYYPTWGGLKMEFVGEKGLATVDAFKQVTTVYSHRHHRPVWSFWGSDPNAGMLREFVNAVRENRPPLVTGNDGLKGVEIIAAAYESANTGQPVPISG
jgi:predicted dehydrogenase